MRSLKLLAAVAVLASAACSRHSGNFDPDNGSFIDNADADADDSGGDNNAETPAQSLNEMMADAVNDSIDLDAAGVGSGAPHGDGTPPR